MIVYYSLSHEDGEDYITTTAKSYWDKNHCVDEGFNDIYNAIEDALIKCGLECSSDSTYYLYDDINKVIQNMKVLGFELQTNHEFEKFLKH